MSVDQRIGRFCAGIASLLGFVSGIAVGHGVPLWIFAPALLSSMVLIVTAIFPPTGR